MRENQICRALQENETGQDRSISLREMTALYYPSNVYPHNHQIYQNIKFMLGNDFLPSGLLSISPDTITPIVNTMEKAQRLPQIKPSDSFELKIADAQGLKLSMSSARRDAMDLYSRYLSTFRSSALFEESNIPLFLQFATSIFDFSLLSMVS